MTGVHFYHLRAGLYANLAFPPTSVAGVSSFSIAKFTSPAFDILQGGVRPACSPTENAKFHAGPVASPAGNDSSLCVSGRSLASQCKLDAAEKF
ncbi:MAG: hypothetical protein ACRD2L_22940, partial [Terriglobia bacterium]